MKKRDKCQLEMWHFFRKDDARGLPFTKVTPCPLEKRLIDEDRRWAKWEQERRALNFDAKLDAKPKAVWQPPKRPLMFWHDSEEDISIYERGHVFYPDVFDRMSQEERDAALEILREIDSAQNIPPPAK